jgi:hypothetical protein
LQIRALGKYRVHAKIAHDTNNHYYLNHALPNAKSKPVFWAVVKTAASKVALHLMTVYTQPEMLTNITPALKKRMQGKSCFNFNFNCIDEALFNEVESLVKQCKSQL